MIFGVGVDLTSVVRFEGVLLRRGGALAARILGAEERALHSGARDPARDLAKRWAVKEAYAKALGTGLRGLRAADIVLLRDGDSGAPTVRLSAQGADISAALGAGRAHLSLSDEGDQVIAMVVIEQASGGA